MSRALSANPLLRPLFPLVAAALFAAALGLRAASAAGLALAAALGALSAVAWLWARIGAKGVAALREHPPRASEDERMPVRIVLRNDGPLPLVGLEVVDVFAADRAAEKRATIYPALPGASEVEVRYRAACDARRGIYAIGPVEIGAWDPWGIARAARTLEVVTRLTVYPKIHPLAAFADTSGGTAFDAGTLAAGRAGVGLEFLGTRPWRPGDPMRLVHWPSTARAGELVVMEMEESAAADVAIYLDLSRMAARGLGRASTVEYAISLGAALAAHLARGHNRVRLYARGARPYDVPAGSGPLQVARVLEALAVARADGATRLADLLRETAADLGRGATAIVVFSSLEIDLREYAEVLALYRARGVRAIAILIDARTFMKVFEEQAEVERAAPEVAELVAALVGEGATVYYVARGDEISNRLAAPLGSGGGAR